MRQIHSGGSSITPATTGARLLLGALDLRLQLGDALVLRINHGRELVDGRLVLAELSLRLELASQIGLAPLLVGDGVEHREDLRRCVATRVTGRPVLTSYIGAILKLY